MLPALNENKKSIIVVITLAVSIMLTEKRAEKYGDMLQIILPVLAGACSFANGNFGDFAARFGVLQLAIHIPKNTLGVIPLNLRPSGNTGGFPSGHASSASFGAIRIVFNCIQGNVFVKSTLILAAAFTGSSRLTAEKHDIWQVFFGWILGFLVGFGRRKSTAVA